jgi:hypothetical protein
MNISGAAPQASAVTNSEIKQVNQVRNNRFSGFWNGLKPFT